MRARKLALSLTPFLFHGVLGQGASTLPPTIGANGWRFIQNGSVGIVALEAIVVSPTLVVMFDRAQHNPMIINNHSAWAALWNLETNTASPLNAVTDTFCASGSILSNGTMASIGGMHVENPQDQPDQDGRMSIRLFGPCEDAAGVGCELFDNPEALHLNITRWYTSTVRIFDGSIMVIGGTLDETPFYNVQPVNSFEFFPKKDGGATRPSDFLARTVPVNLFPRSFALPDGRIFIVANNQSIIYDIEKNIETRLPDIPNGVRVTNPFDGTAQLLPLSPPNYTPEVLVCGGSNSSDQIPSEQLSSQDPASDQCSRIILTEEGIRRGWEVERLLEPRMMPEIIPLPNGQLLITNGARKGYAAIASVGSPVGNTSNADDPVFTPSLYTPDAPLGKRISNAGMPTTNIARVYHSSVTLTPAGNIMLAGSNPNGDVNNGTNFFNTQFQVEFLNPPYMFVERPAFEKAPTQIQFNKKFTTSVSIPNNLRATNIQVSLMDLGFSSHAFHSSARLVFLEHTLSPDRRTLTITAPPNNRIYPPGPAFLFLTIDDVTGPGVRVMVGNGANPPVADQGVTI